MGKLPKDRTTGIAETMETEVENIESENLPYSSTQNPNDISIDNVDFNLNLSTSSASMFDDNSLREENGKLRR